MPDNKIVLRNIPDQRIPVKNDVPVYLNSTIVKKTITINGAYNAATEQVNGYSLVVVNVPTYEAENAELTAEVAALTETVAQKNAEITQLEAKVGAAFDNGKQAEYDRFWDSYQQNGDLKDCGYMFAGDGWNDTTFNPKHTLNPTNALYMFYSCNIKNGSNLKVDFSNSTSLNMCFSGSKLETLPEIRATGNNVDMYYCFNTCYDLKRIEKLVLGETVRRYTSMFAGVSNLEHMIVEGVINQNGFGVEHCKKLDHESLMSIISALYDWSGTGTNMTVGLGADNLAKLTDAEKAIATEKGWTLV